MNFERLFLMSFGLWGSLVLAGNTSGGGGGIFGDAINPWFLENTKEVRYCIEVDQKHFHAASQRLREIVKDSIEIWKNAFAHANRNTYPAKEVEPYGQVRIATQAFIEEPCDKATPLRFEFGILPSEQKMADFEPDEVVGETIRTDYDRVNLKGRGYIYIAPDSGPLRPKMPEMADQVWSYENGIVLERVLLHELGHFFGLGHSGRPYDLMGAEHPEFIVQKSTIENLNKSSKEEVRNYLRQVGIFGFQLPSEKVLCDPPNLIPTGFENSFDEFFSIPKDGRCRKLVFKEDSIEVYASAGKSATYDLIGRVSELKRPLRVTLTMVRVKITPAQRVFSKIPKLASATGYLDGTGAISKNIFEGVYIDRDGKPRGFLKASLFPNQRIDLEGILNNRIVEFIDSGS